MHPPASRHHPTLRSLLTFLTLLTALALVGCSTVDVQQYADNRPRFDLVEYFTGTTIGYGMVQDRRGRLTRQFEVTINGSLNEAGELVLEEFFHWNDGERSTRVWTIRTGEDRAFTGTAGDVVGEATGRVAGNALHWRYHLEVPVDGRLWKIYFDDWMFLQTDDILINRTEMRKFGLRVGEVTIVFHRTKS